MVSLGSIGSTAGGVFVSWMFWGLIVLVVLAVSFGSLYMRKKGKFMFPAVIFQDNGNGRVNLVFTRAGWFKSKKIMGGLIDVGGERRLEIKDGRIVQQGSSRDFHEIGYKAGLLLREKADDPKILVPISKAHLTSEGNRMLMDIAPADFRDACSKIISDSEKEGLSKWETVAQVLVFGFVGMILFISIILTIQYAKNTQASANEVYQDALKFYEKTSQRLSAVPSNANNAP